jgi:glycosyltransferase involved in cell wall biosynthesis
MSRILLPTPDAPPKRGGVARYIGAILRARRDVDVHVLSDREGTLGTLLFLMQYLRAHDDVREIWTHHVLPVGTACFFLSFFLGCFRRSVPSYTVFLHGLDFDMARRNAWKRWLTRCILRRARAIVVNSEGLRAEVEAFSGRNDVGVLYPCVAQELVDASEHTRKGLVHRTPEELAKLLASALATTAGVGISSSTTHANGPVRLLTVARLVARKGHEKVLRALSRVPRVAYTIVGDGPELDHLRNIAEDEGVIDRVQFLTEISDEELPALYVAHDIFVMPTTKHAYDREGFGIAYAEAGLFGLPCIATDISGVNEVIEDGITGMLISDTPDALVSALTRLVESPGLRSRMGTAARVRVLAHFTEACFRERLARLLA